MALWPDVIGWGLVIVIVCGLGYWLLSRLAARLTKESEANLKVMLAGTLPWAEKAKRERGYVEPEVWASFPRWRPRELMWAALDPDYPKRIRALELLNHCFDTHKRTRLNKEYERCLLDLTKDMAMSRWALSALEQYCRKRGKTPLLEQGRVAQKDAIAAAVRALPRYRPDEVFDFFSKGVRQGPVVSINDHVVRTPDDFAGATAGLSAGDIVRLSLMQGGRLTGLAVILAPSRRPSDDWPRIEM